MIVPIFWIIISLLVLTAGAEVLVRGASNLARRLGVSSFFIGLTIVGFGTSTPELAISLRAALLGLSDINVGNVVGSNIMNIALILGVTALLSPIAVNTGVVKRQVLLVIFAAFLPYGALLTGGAVSRLQGLLMTLGLAAFIWTGYRAGRREQAGIDAALNAELGLELGIANTQSSRGWFLQIAAICAGLALLVIGANLLIDNAVAIARSLNVSELVIALTIVAGGTSAPELFTSLVAAVRKQSDIAVGNVLGSNIFNLLGIMGISCMVRPQQISAQVFWLDLPVMIAVSVACLPIMMSQQRISRTEGVMLLCGYAAYLIVLLLVAPRWFA